MDFRARCVFGDRFKENRTALPAVGQDPPPEVDALARPSNRAMSATQEGEVQKDDRVRGAKTSLNNVKLPRSPSMIHPSFATSRSWAATHSSRGVATRPGRQKILSNSTTGRPLISPKRFARVDLPDAPRPRITTRFIFCSVRYRWLNCLQCRIFGKFD